MTRIRLVRVGRPPPFSLHHAFRCVSSGYERRRCAGTQRMQGKLIMISTGLRH